MYACEMLCTGNGQRMVPTFSSDEIKIDSPGITKLIKANNPRNCTASTLGCNIIAFVTVYTPPNRRRLVLSEGYNAAFTIAQHPIACRYRSDAKRRNESSMTRTPFSSQRGSNVASRRDPVLLFLLLDAEDTWCCC